MPSSRALPVASPGSAFTEAQWSTLLAIMDAVIPSIQPIAQRSLPDTADDTSRIFVNSDKFDATITDLKRLAPSNFNREAVSDFYGEMPSHSREFQELLYTTFSVYSRQDMKNVLTKTLDAMNTRIGCYFMTGSTKPFPMQSLRVRGKVLLRWRDSYFRTLNLLYKTMTIMGKAIFIKTSPSFPASSGFPRSPPTLHPGESHAFDFVDFEQGDTPAIIETDIIIVGSGCGGSVCAKNLSEAGHRVLLVEKGYYVHPKQLPMTEAVGGVYLYENGGAIMSDDGSTMAFAGASWGGGGVINWSASLQTEDFVRKEWSERRGLPFFESNAFQSSLDRVCERMGVSVEHIRHSHGNEVLLDGSKKLGWEVKAVPQNTGGKEHYCGHCAYGCGSCEKQGTTASWLPDAAIAGAQFIQGYKVDKVIFEDIDGTNTAVGVKGMWTSNASSPNSDSRQINREVIIKAKKVILSSGSLWSPLILQNSGLKNPHIGQNLYLHPCNFAIGVWPQDIKPWQGSILTAACTSFDNIDGQGHGAKLECCVMMPSTVLAFLNWDSGLDFKTRALRFRHSNAFISIVRDRDTGFVYPDPIDGSPRVAYSPSVIDQQHALEGLLALCRICHATGATEVHVAIAGIKPFVCDTTPIIEPLTRSHKVIDNDIKMNNAKFQEWLGEIRQVGNDTSKAVYTSAHQMGTCRMSNVQEDGVVDPKGRVWGTTGLYVADASIFPSASGVNPMITNMAISDWISRELIQDLKLEQDKWR